MNKAAIEKYAVWARTKLISEITYKMGLLGITDKGVAEPLPQSTNDLQLFDIGTKNYAEVTDIAIKQRSALVDEIKRREKTSNYNTALTSVIEEVAYTWFNRLVAVRFMEVNDYLPSGVRVLSSENKAKNEPDFVTSPFDTDLEFTPYEQDRVIQLKDENKLDELFRMLFIKQCNKLHDILPDLFEKTDDYSELLLTISFTDKDGIVYRLVHDIDEIDFRINEEMYSENGKIKADGQVEIIGWMYQYYNIEPKAEVFGRKSGTKMSKEDIPAATQLFTPDWIVRYMVENSVGRIWIEGHPNNSLRNSWEYYIDEAEQEQQVVAKLEEIKATYKELSPEKIKVIDPCMGSGHILVYAFDVLMQIYESYGYTQRDAARCILQNNIFGLDIDKRAYQLAYFAIMMKARQYNRRILTSGIEPNLCYIQSSNDLSEYALEKMDDYKSITQQLITEFKYASEYGSVLNVSLSEEDLQNIQNQIDYLETHKFDGDLIHQSNCNEAIATVNPILKQAILLTQKYDVVVTNPPYMPVSNADAKLNEYVKKNYPDSKTDLFAVFIERCKQMLRKNGYQAMITMHSWMFLSSYEKLREKMLLNDTINMAHLGARAFEGIGGEVVQTTAFVRRNSSVKKYKSTYCRLLEPNTQQGKEDMFLTGENRYTADQSNFSKIPGSPIAYWVSENIVAAFSNKTLHDFSISPSQNVTGNNSMYVRKFWELSNSKVGGKDEWIFYCKGGGYRKWWGNLEDVVNWTPSARQIYQFGDGKHASQIINKEYWYKKGITWGLITSAIPSFRIMPEGATYDKGGSTIIVDEDIYNFALALLNSKIYLKIASMLNPTLNFQVKDVRSVPIILKCKNEIEHLVQENTEQSKNDWDSFETSWDFKEHPLVRLSKDLWDATAVGVTMSYYYGGHPKVGSPVELCYMLWQGECNERFNKLKTNEEELNRIFIDIYGLGDELTPEVEDKDVTVRKADLQRDIKSLISYAVGCMFGRYSLDTEGIAYAGGDWDTGKYERFIPDADNCIPITDEEYFEDDIVGLFCAWLKKVYGEDSLEQNLDFIAKALGNKGATSREVIRNYFLNDFIKDHIKTYQKRPIYWLFDSGKQNGFKALCYMHRWNTDTTGNMRVEYLHRMQRVYEKEIERMQEIIDNSQDNKEISNATKRKEKLQKQIKETKDYDAKVAHLALSRIDIDLDDGVKVNYEKVQTASDGKKMQILAKI